MPSKNELGPFIRELRSQQKPKMSLRKLARLVGVSATFICKLENEGASPSAETLDEMAKILGHRDEIFKKAGKMPPELNRVLDDVEVRKFMRQLVGLTTPQRRELFAKLIGDKDDKG